VLISIIFGSQNAFLYKSADITENIKEYRSFSLSKQLICLYIRITIKLNSAKAAISALAAASARALFFSAAQ